MNSGLITRRLAALRTQSNTEALLCSGDGALPGHLRVGAHRHTKADRELLFTRLGVGGGLEFSLDHDRWSDACSHMWDTAGAAGVARVGF